MAIAYLSLGSNIGDRVGHIQQATSLLKGFENINIIQTSSFYETEPWGTNTQNWFVNAVMQVTTTLSTQNLLIQCQKVETILGRNRDSEEKYGDRSIDIDILFYDDAIISEYVEDQKLIIPHPLMDKRAFVLVPFLEISPDFIHPVYKKSINDLYEELEAPEMVYLYGTRV